MILDAFPHVLPREWLTRARAVGSGPALEFVRGLEGRPHLAPMWDMDARFRQMDQAGDYAQILTLCLPPVEQVATGADAVDLARLANDCMAELVTKHADRFKGFAATLPMQDPDASCAELERCMNGLSALGAQVFTNVNGRALDDERYEPLWARLTQLDGTLWVHGARRPTTPDYEGEDRSRFGIWAGLGWPYEMGLFSARFVAAGIFDRHPSLRVYLHHSGGMTATFSRRVSPSWLELEAAAPEDRAAYARLKQPLAEYWKLFYADTSGQSPIAIRAALEFFGHEHVLMGSDAPFVAPANHLATLAQLTLSDAERAMLLGGNAQRVLRLSPA